MKSDIKYISPETKSELIANGINIETVERFEKEIKQYEEESIEHEDNEYTFLTASVLWYTGSMCIEDLIEEHNE